MERNIENRECESGANSLLVNRIKTILEKNKFRKINGNDIRTQLQSEGNYITSLQLRKLIKFLRKEGNPIIASPLGYKWCDLKNENDRKELGEYIESRRLELRDESITINKLSQVLTKECLEGDLITMNGGQR